MKGLLATRPYLRPMIWAGNRLGITPSGEERVGEALDVSGLHHMSSFISQAADEFRDLAGAYGEWAAHLVGGEEPPDRLPLLVKRIDAGDDLSVQVHPDDALASSLEGEPNGKHEAWVILAAEPGARIVLGFKEGVTREEAERAFREGRPGELLRDIPVRAGDVVPVPAGCVHAIGKGIYLFEVQQPSSVTYRLFDPDRPEAGGPRPLHLSRGFQAMDVDKRPPVRNFDIFQADADPGRRVLCDMPTFRIESFRVTESGGPLDVAGGNLAVVQVVSGAATLVRGEERLDLAGLGATALVPAEGGVWRLESSGASLLLAFHQ